MVRIIAIRVVDRIKESGHGSVLMKGNMARIWA